MTIRPKVPDRAPQRSSTRPSRTLGAATAIAGTPQQNGPASRKGATAAAQATDSNTRCIVYSKRSVSRGSGSYDISNNASKLLLQVRLETSPQLLQQVGDFVGSYSKYRFQPRIAERISLASFELIENAVSYGSVSGDVVYQLSDTDRWMEICVTNDSSAGRLANLRAQLERLRIDPEKVFQEEMAKSMSTTGGRAALGLARICHEGQMDLEFEVDGTRVSMRARCGR